MSKQNALATNKRAYHNYHVLETWEAGIQLVGTEVKSIRQGKVDIKEAIVRIENEEAFLVGCHVHHYEFGNYANHEPLRRRKLLLHKREIIRLLGKVQEKGLTLIPLRFYLKNGRIKLEFGLCRGKKLHDKRETLKKHEATRDIERALKDRS
ncbi:MAG: SsrA-binding protein SmpB [Nitrospirota bacterium]|nr:SsrA-binding protein SmpB [Nitrospirota bacterium]